MNFWEFADKHLVGLVFFSFLLFLFVESIVSKIIRHYNIKSKGWPPGHIDADGDFRKKDSK